MQPKITVIFQNSASFLYFDRQMKNKLPALLNLLFSLLMVVFCVENAQAATPVIHIAPKPDWISPCKPYDKKPQQRNIENGAYDELIEEQVNVEKSHLQSFYNTDHVIGIQAFKTILIFL